MTRWPDSLIPHSPPMPECSTHHPPHHCSFSTPPLASSQIPICHRLSRNNSKHVLPRRPPNNQGANFAWMHSICPGHMTHSVPRHHCAGISNVMPSRINEFIVCLHSNQPTRLNPPHQYPHIANHRTHYNESYEQINCRSCQPRFR
jgi:hypothetical protein